MIRSWIAEPFDNAGARQAHPGFGTGLFGLDQLTVARTHHGISHNAPLRRAGLVDGDDTAALGALAEDADHPLGVAADAAD